MHTSRSIRSAIVLMACAFTLGYSVAALADDMASFATGGYARGLRSEKLMHKIDTNGDGMVSKDEWIAYQEKVFSMLDKNKTGTLDTKTFVDPRGGDLVSFGDFVDASLEGFASLPALHALRASSETILATRIPDLICSICWVPWGWVCEVFWTGRRTVRDKLPNAQRAQRSARGEEQQARLRSERTGPEPAAQPDSRSAMR